MAPASDAFSLTGVLASLPAAAVLIYILLLTALFLRQRQILFRPDRSRPVPSLAGVDAVEQIAVPTADGLELDSWWLPPAHGAPVVLYLQGNAGHIGHRGERLRRFAAQGWGALLLGYRGYGGNPGAPSEAGLLADANAALAELARRGIAPTRLVLWGESLGSGVAVAAAAGREIGALVLETPFTSITALAKRRYPYVPVERLLKDRFDSLGRIGAVRCPILIATAGQDRVVPPDMGIRLREAAAAPAELWHAAAAGHSDLAAFGLVEAAAEFLRRRLAG